MAQITIGITEEAKILLDELAEYTELSKIKLASKAIFLLHKATMPAKTGGAKCTCGLGDDHHVAAHPATCGAFTSF